MPLHKEPQSTPERKYALVKIAAGDYLFPSNDRYGDRRSAPLVDAARALLEMAEDDPGEGMI